MSTLLVSTTVLASFVGGIVALAAPCCISVMLPAYFASTFKRRTQIIGMTLVFATGVGTIILPIALGATAISRLLLEQHRWVFGIGGILMIVAGFAMLAGKSFSLPMIGGKGATDGSLRSVYALGVFSGGASACCAPVLVGVAALAGASASFPVALIIGAAYVFGMVAPLALIAVVWDQRDWGSSRLLRDRKINLGLRHARITVPLTVAVSGFLMVFMGVLTGALALSGRGMATGDWQVRMAASLQHVAARVLDALSWMPGWAGTLLILGLLAALVVAGLRQRPSRASAAHDGDQSTEPVRSHPATSPDQADDDRRLEKS